MGSNIFGIKGWGNQSSHFKILKCGYQHSGYLGNEKADSLAKRGANNTDTTLLKLPIPKVTWGVAIRERTKHNI